MKHGRKLLHRKEMDQRPVKLVPMVSANVTTKTPAHQAQPVLQAKQERKANLELQVKLDPKANPVPEAPDTTQPLNLAENAHRALQEPKDQPDHQAKEEKRANQVATVHQAKMEESEVLDHQDQPENQAKMANPEQPAHQAKTVSQAPKANQVKQEVQATMVQQDRKDQLAPMAKPVHQVQPAHQAQQAKMAVQARKAPLANQEEQVVQAKTPNTAHAHDEASIIKYHLQFYFQFFDSQLLQIKFQNIVILIILTNI